VHSGFSRINARRIPSPSLTASSSGLKSLRMTAFCEVLFRTEAYGRKGDRVGRPVVVLSPSLPDDLEVGAAPVIDPNAAAIEAPAIALPAG
jgi:hypothetical protein